MNVAPSPPAALLAAAALGAVVIGGCGESGDELSTEELVQRGDEVCRRVADDFSAIQAQPPANASEGADQARELLQVADDAQNELRELEPPEEIGDAYDRYIDARQEVSVSLQRGRSAAENQDGAGYGKAQEEAAAGAPERRRLARQLGFRVCSQGTGVP
jgi:hypothetical protein